MSLDEATLAELKSAIYDRKHQLENKLTQTKSQINSLHLQLKHLEMSKTVEELSLGRVIDVLRELNKDRP